MAGVSTSAVSSCLTCRRTEIVEEFKGAITEVGNPAFFELATDHWKLT